jgi:hypothetical protein
MDNATSDAKADPSNFRRQLIDKSANPQIHYVSSPAVDVWIWWLAMDGVLELPGGPEDQP